MRKPAPSLGCGYVRLSTPPILPDWLLANHQYIYQPIRATHLQHTEYPTLSGPEDYQNSSEQAQNSVPPSLTGLLELTLVFGCFHQLLENRVLTDLITVVNQFRFYYTKEC
ncbi:hypothetical protein STEG23_033133 [Scotinomys teguina]